MGALRKRRVKSVKGELLKKSREAALAAVQIFNSPSITFKAESYIVLMIIAWTYLLHAYFRSRKIEYRYFREENGRRHFDRTTHGAFKYWELERCLNEKLTPVDKNTSNNLRFLIGLRHEIEHQMTTRIDDMLSARFQACCLNYNDTIKKLFGSEFGIEKHLSFSLQFSGVSMEQKSLLDEYPNLPTNILAYVNSFDSGLSDEEFSSPKYAYRLLFVPKTANHKGQADRVIEFVRSDSPLADEVNKAYVVIKESDKQKFLPSQIVKLMQQEGFLKFRMKEFVDLWKSKDARAKGSVYGALVAGKAWYWFSNWVEVVRKHCAENAVIYGKIVSSDNK